VWTRLAGVPLWSFRLGNWSYWLITIGIGSMAIVLSAQGLQQGFMLMTGAEFVDTIVSMRPYWWIRTLTGISMDVGMSLLVINLMRTSAVSRRLP
jgi:cytochrome c oxidase cbb3-type subunit 1